MAHAVLQARRQGVPVLGICGGYQMLGETIIDEVESVGTSRGWVAQYRHPLCAQQNDPGNGDSGSGAAGVAGGNGGLAVSGYEIHMGETSCARLPFADAIT